MHNNSSLKEIDRKHSVYRPTYPAIAQSQNFGANRISLSQQHHYLSNERHLELKSQAHPIVSSPKYQLSSQKIPYTPIFNNQSAFLRQNRIIDENPPVVLRQSHSYNFDTHRIPMALGLPQLPGLMLPEQKNTNLIQLTAQKDDKCTFCRIFPWILAFLLLLALIATLLLFFFFRHHHIKEPNLQNKQSLQPLQPVQQAQPGQSRSPCIKPICGLEAKIHPQADYLIPQDYRRQQTKTQKNYTKVQPTPITPITLSQMTPYERFYQEDHSNYKYLHLRKQQPSLIK